MVKLELISSSVRDDLLNAKHMLIDNVSYEISEYLASAHVLICSKCLAIGHFKKQCQQIKDTCRVCGELVDDIKSHRCSNIEKCMHCGQNHKSNSLKCLIIKQYRAELTRKVLHVNKDPIAIDLNSRPGYSFHPSHFPPLPLSTSSSLNNPIMNKLDDLCSKLSSVQTQLSNLEIKHDKFDLFMLEKNKSDDRIYASIDKIATDHVDFKKSLSQISTLFDQHENLFLKLIFPLFDDICTYIINVKNKASDVNMKNNLERYKILLNKAIEGKQSSI